MHVNPLIMLYGLCAAVSYGLADYLGARASKKLGPVTSAFCTQLVGTLLYSLYYVVWVHRLPVITAGTWPYIITGSASVAFGVCALYTAFKIGPVSMASPLSSAYPFVAAIAGIAFFHAKLNMMQFIGIGILVFGVMAAAGLFSGSTRGHRLSAGPMFALLATCLGGVGFPLINRAIIVDGWQAVTLIEMLLLCAAMAAVLAVRARAEQFRISQLAFAMRDTHVLGSGAMQMAAGLAINLGFVYDAAAGALVLAFSSTYPVLTMALAFKHFKEQVEAWLLVGAGCTIAGVILLVV